MNSGRNRYIFDGILFAVAICMYAPSLWCGFVGDDLIYFIGNMFIRTFDIVTILRSGATGADYLPLRDISFAIDYRVWGENPFGFHLTNVLLFGIFVIILRHFFVLLSNFLCNNKNNNVEAISIFAAMVVAVHPNHREVVYAVFNRGALLTVIFSLSSVIMFIKFLVIQSKYKYLYYVVSLVMFVSALLSREYCLTLPLVLAMLIFLNKKSNNKITEFITLIPFIIIVENFFNIFRKYAVGGQFISQESSLFSGILSKTSLALEIILFYMVRMITSLGQFNFDGSSGLTLFSGVVVAGLIIVSVWKMNTFPQLFFGLFFYLACLLPVLNFYKTLPIVSPRYSFLSCIGLFFVIMSIPFVGRIRIVPIVLVSATFTWTMLTMHKTSYWKDNLAFWEFHASRESSTLVKTQLGYAYYDGRQYEKAFESLRSVLSTPTDPKYFEALGNSCFEIGNYPCAIQSYEQLMTFDERRNQAITYLWKTYQRTGDQLNAKKYFEMSKINPSVDDLKIR